MVVHVKGKVIETCSKYNSSNKLFVYCWRSRPGLLCSCTTNIQMWITFGVIFHIRYVSLFHTLFVGSWHRDTHTCTFKKKVVLGKADDLVLLFVDHLCIFSCIQSLLVASWLSGGAEGVLGVGRSSMPRSCFGSSVLTFDTALTQCWVAAHLRRCNRHARKMQATRRREKFVGNCNWTSI